MFTEIDSRWSCTAKSRIAVDGRISRGFSVGFGHELSASREATVFVSTIAGAYLAHLWCGCGFGAPVEVVGSLVPVAEYRGDPIRVALGV